MVDCVLCNDTGRWYNDNTRYECKCGAPYVKQEIKEDNVNAPTHYNQHGVECIEAIQASMSDAEFRGYLKGNALKYQWRYAYKKKPLEDLQKAEWYLQRLIKEVKKIKSL